jgi:hypothetical protein
MTLAECLRPLTEQELRDFVPLTDAEIEAALAAGRRDREREEAAIGRGPTCRGAA